jgi:hypothetical protein
MQLARKAKLSCCRNLIIRQAVHCMLAAGPIAMQNSYQKAHALHKVAPHQAQSDAGQINPVVPSSLREVLQQSSLGSQGLLSPHHASVDNMKQPQSSIMYLSFMLPSNKHKRKTNICSLTHSSCYVGLLSRVICLSQALSSALSTHHLLMNMHAMVMQHPHSTTHTGVKQGDLHTHFMLNRTAQWSRTTSTERSIACFQKLHIRTVPLGCKPK